MKTTILAIIVAAVVSFGVTYTLKNDAPQGPGQQKAASTSPIYDRVIKSGTIKCGYATWSPVQYSDPNTGELGGITYDIMNAVGDKLGLNVEWQEEVGWDALVEGLVTDRYDMFCTALLINGTRGRRMNWTIPYFYSPLQLVVRADEARFTDVKDLNDERYKLSVLEGEAGALFAAKNYPNAGIVAVPQVSGYAQVLVEVSSGRVDATLIEPSTFREYNAANPGKLKYLDPDSPLGVFPVAFGVQQGDYRFKAMVDAALTELLSDGTIDVIMRKYDAHTLFMPPANPYGPLPGE